MAEMADMMDEPDIWRRVLDLPNEEPAELRSPASVGCVVDVSILSKRRNELLTAVCALGHRGCGVLDSPSLALRRCRTPQMHAQTTDWLMQQQTKTTMLETSSVTPQVESKSSGTSTVTSVVALLKRLT